MKHVLSRPDVPQWSIFWTIVSIVVVALLYMSFLYRPWKSPEELRPLMGSLVLMGVSIGLVVSMLPIKRTYVTALVTTTPAPSLSFILHFVLTNYVRVAQASSLSEPVSPSRGEYTDPLQLILTIVFLIVSGIIFGVAACFGSYIGLWIQAKVGRTFESRTEIEKAKIGMWATLGSACISGVFSIIIKLLA